MKAANITGYTNGRKPMSRYVIRSMSTTDYDYRDPKPVTPYHIYLLPRDKRDGAYWACYGYETFTSVQDAIREALASKINCFQIVRDDDKSTYWDTYKRELL